MTTQDIPMTRAGFERALRDLQKEAANTPDNPGSYRSEGCTRCSGCMFTTDSTDCFGCTYCAECVRCSSCTHCTRCEDCYDSSYCVESRYCGRSSYLLFSEHCFDCVFCFGCVGLVKKEFHILNQPFSRKEYFERLEELKAEFGLAK